MRFRPCSRLRPSALAVLLACALLTLGPGASAAAQGAPHCPPGREARFVLGFASLKERLGPIMGEPLECEHANAENGDSLQRTTTGLAFYRNATNTPTFTDGFRHWALTPRGLVTWEGAAVDPPPDATPVSPPVAAASRYTRPTIPAPGDGSWCLEENPSCGRDPWWVAWNELQQREQVQYEFLDPGLVTERRFAEAIRLLWQWPEGQFLLREAAAHGTTITSEPFGSFVPAFASYTPARRAIVVNRQFTETSTWMLADVIAHELKHVADHRARARQADTFEDCIAIERVAYEVERRFLDWLVERYGSLPTFEMVLDQLSLEDVNLYDNLYGIATSPDLRQEALDDYRGACTG